MRPFLPAGESSHEDRSPITRVIWRRIKPECEAEFEEVSRQLIAASAKFDGCLGIEVFPPIPGIQDAYVTLHHYESTAHLQRWLGSAERAALVPRIEPLMVEPAFECYLPGRRRSAGAISTVFAYDVKTERLADFAAWRRRIIAAGRRQPGFLGSESFDTFGEQKQKFLAVVRFDTREHFEAWLATPERARLMEEVRDYVNNFDVRRVGTGFEGWFGDSLDGATPPPTRWRQALVVLAALFPVIMLLRQVFSRLFEILPTPVAFLILLTCDLAILTWGVMPWFSRLMGFWLHPKPDHDWQRELAGLAILGASIGLTLTLTLALGNAR